MRLLSQLFRLASVMAGCFALAACVSDDAGVRSRQQKEAECAHYQVNAPGQDPQSMRDQSRYDSRDKDHPYYGPPPNTPEDPQSPVPSVSCRGFE